MKEGRKNSEARIRANAKYDASHTTRYSLKLNNDYDAESVAKLKSVPNVQRYLKDLIRADIMRDKAIASAKRTAAEKVFTGTAYDPAVMISETADADESIKALVSEEKFVEFWTNYFTGKLADLSK